MNIELVSVSAIVSVLVLQIAILKVVYGQGREMGQQDERLKTAVAEIAALRTKAHELSGAVQRLSAIEERR
jgi:hypothetical protein